MIMMKDGDYEKVKKAADEIYKSKEFRDKIINSGEHADAVEFRRDAEFVAKAAGDRVAQKYYPGMQEKKMTFNDWQDWEDGDFYKRFMNTLEEMDESGVYNLALDTSEYDRQRIKEFVSDYLSVNINSAAVERASGILYRLAENDDGLDEKTSVHPYIGELYNPPKDGKISMYTYANRYWDT